MILKSALLVFGLLTSELAPTIQARDIPPNLRSFYDTVKQNPCSHPLRTGFQDGHGNWGFTYCNDHKGLIYISGPRTRPLSDMDIDCDGSDRHAGSCAEDTTGQDETSFRNTVETFGIRDLNSSIHSYVVFGNQDSRPFFDPRKVGMEPLGVMAVVCNDQLFYGVWGDKNGGVYTGEASISLATACFPDLGITGNNGYNEHDVLYLGFVGKDAVPGAEGADWTAQSFGEFEASLAPIGDALVARVFANEQKPDSDTGLVSRPRSSSAAYVWILLLALAMY